MEPAGRQLCLDVMKVSWSGTQGLRQSDCGILLEIESSGGLLQTTVAIPGGSEMTLDNGLGLVHGKVTSCEQDDYGFNVNFIVIDRGVDWYPEYVPAFIHSASGG
jgi:hypothetical protein